MNATVYPKLRWLLVGALAVTVAGPALASNFGSQGGVGSTDTNIGGIIYPNTTGVFLQPDSIYDVLQRNVNAVNATAINSSISNDYNWTDLSAATWAVSNCPTSGNHVCVFDDNYGDNNFLGWNQCRSGWSGSHPNMTCEIDHIKLNLYYTPSNYTALACHELGHSLGLRHDNGMPDPSCMQDNPPSWHSWLSSEDIDHLNGRY
jgi:hypothetical protein